LIEHTPNVLLWRMESRADNGQVSAKGKKYQNAT